MMGQVDLHKLGQDVPRLNLPHRGSTCPRYIFVCAYLGLVNWLRAHNVLSFSQPILPVGAEGL